MANTRARMKNPRLVVPAGVVDARGDGEKGRRAGQDDRRCSPSREPEKWLQHLPGPG